MATRRQLAHVRTMNVHALTSFLKSSVTASPAFLGTLIQRLPNLSLVLKAVAGFILLFNIRSLPFAWHIRVWWPVLILHFRWQKYRIQHLFKSKEEKKTARRIWVESLAPLGANPISRDFVYKTWADFSDADYNLHLSNSSYPKTLDGARMRSALDYFPGFMIAGGWIALAATHFNFMKEIPIFAPYEVRLSLASWDQKWIFLIARYVTFPKKGQNKRREEHGHPSNGAPIPTLHTPANGVDTPVTGSSTPNPSQVDLKALANTVSPIEADGAVVNCVSINQLVFKLGRITVPPAVVLAYDGFCFHEGEGLRDNKYSHANPPPHWKHVQAIRAQGRKAELAFLRGGWRDVPKGERWWETALAGAEYIRKTNMDKIKGVREGLEGGRSVASELFS